MICPICHKSNPVNSRYCIFCGNRFSTASTEIPPALAEIQQLRQLLNQNYNYLHQIDKRLAALEKGMQIPMAAPEEKVPPAPETPSLTYETLTENPKSAEAPKVEQWEPPLPRSEVVGATAEPKPAMPPGEWEQILGGNWLARIGVFALLIGIAFFLKYAFDRNWISPAIRVLMGGILGLLLLGGGYLWWNKYPVMTQVLTGGGVGVMFLSVFAAFSVYNLIPFLVAVALLLIVSAASVFFALRYNSMALSILGVIGAFLAPLLLGITGKGGVNSGIAIPIYLIIVDIGVLYISTLRNWRWFTVLSFLFSILIFQITYGKFHTSVGVAAEETFLTVLFLIFVGTTVLFNVIWRKAANELDWGLMVFNAAYYFGVSYFIMWSSLRDWMGFFSLIIAIFYSGLFYLIRKRGKENQTLSLFSLVIALIFLTIAIPVQIHNHFWMPIAWAGEFVALMWLAKPVRLSQLRYFGYGVFVLIAARLLFFDTAVKINSFQPIFNGRFLAYATGILAAYLGFLLLRRDRELIPEWKTPASTLAIAANFLTLWWLSFEIWNFFDKQVLNGMAGSIARNAQNLSLTALWLVYAVVLLVVGIARRSRAVRLGGLALIAVSIIKVFVYDVFTLSTLYRIVAFVGLGILLLVGGFLYQRYSARIKEFLTK
jgi:uncharacterized membrane protein